MVLELIPAKINFSYFYRDNKFDSPQRQYLSLPFNFICYVTEKPSSALGYQKLKKTCKYFFSKKKIVVANTNFMYTQNRTYYFEAKESPIIPLSINEGQFWLIKSFHLFQSMNLPQNIYRYDFIIELSVVYATLAKNEINIILLSKKLKSLVWSYVTIENDDAVKPLTIDKLLSKVPTITQFTYCNPIEIFTAETFQKLNNLNFTEKFDLFYIENFVVSDEMDPSNFCNFIKKTAASNSHFEFKFPSDARSNDYLALKAAVDKLISEWPTEKNKKKEMEKTILNKTNDDKPKIILRFLS